jgi:hypothetical protein
MSDEKLPPGATALTKELLEATFWDRPPEQIHTDLHRTPDPELTVAMELAAHRVRKELGALPEAEHEIAGLLLHPWFEQWTTAAPEEKDQLADLAVVFALYISDGPAKAFQRPAVANHLDHLWQAMHDETLTPVHRKRARDRWLWIMRFGLPNFRKIKNSANPLAVAQAVEEARRKLAPIRKRRWRSLASLRLSLKEKFPTFRASFINALADGIVARDKEKVRKALLKGVGLPFNREPGAMRELAAQGRKLMAKERELAELGRRAEAGRQRYKEWLTQQGFSASTITS